MCTIKDHFLDFPSNLHIYLWRQKAIIASFKKDKYIYLSLALYKGKYQVENDAFFLIIPLMKVQRIFYCGEEA